MGFGGDVERGLVVFDAHLYVAAIREFAEQQGVGERLFEAFLNDPGQRSRAVALVVALFGEPRARLVGEFDGDVAVGELALELGDEFVHHAMDHFRRQGRKADDRVEAVAEFRREHAFDGLSVVAGAGIAGEPDGRFGEFRGAGVGGHDEHGVAETHRLAVVVGEFAVVHDLKQDVEQVGVGFLDLVEQQHGVGVLVDGVGEQTALVEADIAGRGADQPRHGMALHIFRHVEAHEFDAHDEGELARRFGLADSGGAGEQVAADGLLGFAQAGAREFDGVAQRLDGPLLSEHDGLEVGSERRQHFLVVAADLPGRDARHFGDDALDLVLVDGGLAPVFGQQRLGGADLVDDVDRLVGQFAVADIAVRQFDGGAQRVAGIFDAVIFLVTGFEAFEDLHRVADRRLLDVDLLEAAHQGAVLFEIVAVFLVGGGADAAKRAALQRGLEEVRGVHGAARGGAGADDGVDLVDEEDRAVMAFDLGEHRLHALLEVAAVAGSGEQRSHVEREDRGALQHFGNLAVDDAPGQALGDGGFADPRVADEERVVLGPPAQYLDHALDFEGAPDQRVYAPVARPGVEVDAIGRERRQPLLDRRFALLVAFRAGGRAGFRQSGGLGDAVADVAHGVEAAHILPLQVENGVRFAFGEYRDQHVGAGDFLAARHLYVVDGALDHALETRRRLGAGVAAVNDGRRLLALEELDEGGAQRVDIDAAGAHDRERILVLGQRQQEVFESGELVLPLVGKRDRAMQGGL